MVKTKKRKWWWYKEYLFPETKIVNLGFNYGITLPNNLVKKFKLGHKEEYIVFLFKTVSDERKIYPVYLGLRPLIKITSTRFGFTIPKDKMDLFQPGEIVYPTILKKNFITKEQIETKLREAISQELEMELLARKLIEEAELNL